MNARDARVVAALEAAFDRIEATAAAAIAEAPQPLAIAMRDAPTYHDRSQLAAAHELLLARRVPLARAFNAALRAKVDKELAADASGAGALPGVGESQWASIGLVDEAQIQADIAYSRIGQLISHECEAELREQSGYLSALLRHGRADPERDPLRGAVVGWAMHHAIESVAADPSVERVLARQLGQTLSKAMKPCYGAIVEDLKTRGIRKAELVARSLDPGGARGLTPSPAVQGLHAEEALQSWERSLTGRLVIDAGDGAARWEPRVVAAATSEAEARAGSEDIAQGAAVLLQRLLRGDAPVALRPFAVDAALAHERDSGLTAVVRSLNRRVTDTDTTVSNLIRTHRAALERASAGKLDHLVIEIVGDLFDAIFADPDLQPQIARQLARLQLPVLRVAMRDPAFFASRAHPVRRFVNRIASLGVAIEEPDSGPGRAWLGRIADLVQQIVQGEFEQVSLFEDKLLELERFAAEQARAEIKESPAARTIQHKEVEWRRLSRFSATLREALAPLALEPYLRDFLAQTWAQAVVTALQADGTESPASSSFRSAGLELATSVLPKRMLEDRKRFLSALPGLMATLQQGMDLVRWPQPERDAFFGRLIEAHAGSLKAAPWSELDHNLHVKRLELIFRTPIVSEAEAGAPPPPLRAPKVEQPFSSDDARRVGLIDERDVDWSRAAAPDPARAASIVGPGDEGELARQPESAAAGHPGEALEAGPGPALRAQLQVGLSYRLLLQDQWQKVRLSYMSPGRNFFMFTHGSKDRRSISMTARMLDRLCAAARLHAYESALLIDRATLRVQAGPLAPSSA